LDKNNDTIGLAAIFTIRDNVKVDFVKNGIWEFWKRAPHLEYDTIRKPMYKSKHKK